MTEGPASIHRALCIVLVMIFTVFVTAASTQYPQCGTLADVLRFGADETEVSSMRDEARRLYRWACDDQSRSTARRTDAEINAAYELFSFGAKNNSSTIEEYRRTHCSLNEDDVTTLVSRSFRQRRVNPGAVAAWSACINRMGISLGPELDSSQNVASFSITYDDARLSRPPILRGISSNTFACQTAGEGRVIGVGGNPMEISSTEALVIRCDRGFETGDIEGRSVTVYPEDSLILDLSTGAHRIDFAKRREGPAVEEFAELQERVSNLSAAVKMLEDEVRVQVGDIEMRPTGRRGGETYTHLFGDAPGVSGLLDSGEMRGMRDGRVTFPMAFASTPEVFVALRAIDANRTRIAIVVTAVDREGFNYELLTWSNTQLFGVHASWIALIP